MDELAMSLVWSRIGFWGCALWLMLGGYLAFQASGEASDKGLFIALIAFVGICFFGMHY